MLRLLLISLLVLTGCHHAVRADAVQSLVGITAPLQSSPALRLVLPVTVDGIEGELTIDPSQPVSFVSEPCLRSPNIIARVTVPDAFGPDEAYQLTRVAGLVINGTAFRSFDAALAAGKSCVVVLGATDLADVAVEVNPATRTVRFLQTQPRSKWLKLAG
ncbi:MAG: hypothetical protein ACO1OB_34775 [Archangium sp.]